MSRLRLIVGLTVSTTIGLVAGCFRDGTPPPAFRFNCEADSDCEALLDNMGEPVLDENGDPYAEQCIAGLCQYACSGSVLGFIDPSAASGCPPDNDGYTCNHLCDAAADPPECSDPQTCVEFAEFGDIPNLEDILEQLPQERPGICGVLCDAEDASTCPDGQLCFDGLCIDLSGGIPDTTATSGGTGDGTTGDMTTGDMTTGDTTGSTGP